MLVSSQKRLRNVLAKLDVADLEDRNDGGSRKHVLWLLCVGGSTCDAEGREWYAKKIAELLDYLDARGEIVRSRDVGMQELKEHLREFVWAAKLDGVGFAELWDVVWEEITLIPSKQSLGSGAWWVTSSDGIFTIQENSEGYRASTTVYKADALPKNTSIQTPQTPPSSR